MGKFQRNFIEILKKFQGIFKKNVIENLKKILKKFYGKLKKKFYREF